MYRVFLSLLILSAALLNPLFVLAESRTIVTRRPVYNNRFNNRHYHRPPNRIDTIITDVLITDQIISTIMLIIREDFSIQEEVHFLTLAHLNNTH